MINLGQMGITRLTEGFLCVYLPRLGIIHVLKVPFDDRLYSEILSTGEKFYNKFLQRESDKTESGKALNIQELIEWQEENSPAGIISSEV